LIFRAFTQDELPEELRLPVDESIDSASMLLKEQEPVAKQARRPSISAHSLALRDPNYDFWLLTHRKVKSLSDAFLPIPLTANRSSFRRRYSDKRWSSKATDSSQDQANEGSSNLTITATTRANLVHASMFLLSLKALQKQLASSLTQESLSHLFARTSSSNSAAVSSFLSTFQVTLILHWNSNLPLPFTASTVASTLSSSDHVIMLLQAIIEMLLSSLTNLIIASDSSIHAKILPVSLSAPGSDSSTSSSADAQLQEDILQSPAALAEYLAMQIFRSIQSKNVRVPAMLGVGGFFNPNFSLNTPQSSSGSTLTPTSSSSALQDATGASVTPDRLPLSRSNTANEGVSTSTTYEYAVEGIEPGDILSWLTSDGKSCLKLAMRYGIFDKLLASISVDVSSSSASSTEPSSSASMDQDPSSRQLPTSSSDLNALAKHLVSYLVQYRVIVPVVRPADGSFSTPTSYYKYRDTWEVKLSLDNSLNQSSTATKSKLGRQYYSAISSTSMAEASTHTLVHEATSSSSVVHMSSSLLSTIPPSILRREIGNDDDLSMLTKLWSALKGDWYLVHAISTAYPWNQRIPPAMTSSTSSQPPSSSVYAQSIACYLYRNALLARMQLPYRFLAQLQVEICGLKEIKGRPDHFSFVQSSAQSIESYSIVRLSRRSTTRPALARSSSQSNITSTAIANTAAGLEYIATQSIVTASKRADSVKVANMFLSSNQATEYNYSESFLFKFPFPEDRIAALASGSTASCMQESIDETLFPLLATYPQILGLSILEKTFFSEKKLGELELPLDDINEERGFRDWIPLSTEKSSTWLALLQVQLKFGLMMIENIPISKEIGTNLSRKISSASLSAIGGEDASSSAARGMLSSDTPTAAGADGADTALAAKVSDHALLSV
jgi:hypothetical protein